MNDNYQEWVCKCGNQIDAPDITGIRCNECWLKNEEVPTA